MDFDSFRDCLLSDPAFLPAHLKEMEDIHLGSFESQACLRMTHHRLIMLKDSMRITDPHLSPTLHQQILTRSARAFYRFYLSGEEVHLKKLAAEVADLLLYATCNAADGGLDF